MRPIPSEIPALVTGASSGIGRELARLLAARGHDVVVVARRGDRLEALREELTAAHGVTVTPLVADLETDEGAAAVERRLRAGGPWLLVNNAGFGSRGRVAELDPEREDAEVRLNVLALHRLAVAAVQVSLPAGAGGVLNVASQAGFQPIPYMATYAATKAFVLHFTEALAVELRGTGVRTTALCPGPVRTEFTQGGMDREARMFAPLFISAERCAATALRALDRGEVICTPGALTTVATAAVHAVPRAALRTTVGRVQEALRLDRTRGHPGAGGGAPASPASSGRRRRPRAGSGRSR